MPEGPEVKLSTHALNRRIVGWSATPLALGGRYASAPPEGWAEFCADAGAAGGLTVLAVECKGKFMYWALDRGWHLWCTYGMTGQWSSGRTPHSAVTLRLERPGQGCGFELSFNDPRRFGTVRLSRDLAALGAKLASLGPDMLSSPPDAPEFAERLLARPDRSVAEALMDQSSVSGVGNYVKSEALYAAGVSPWRRLTDLSAAEFVALRDGVVDVMQKSYALGGATLSTYRDPSGRPGSAQRRFAVYGQATDPAGARVIREETSDGRTSWWCPSAQR